MAAAHNKDSVPPPGGARPCYRVWPRVAGELGTKAIAYTYSILRYVHDPAVGEALNIGVVLYAPSVRFLAVRLEYRYQRLSQTFAGFDGDQYRTALRQLESAIEWVKDTWSGRSAQDLPADFQGLIPYLCPDQGLSFQFGPVLAGLTDDPDATLASVFDRMVSSQIPRKLREENEAEAFAMELDGYTPENDVLTDTTPLKADAKR
jgi:hypothetical protein